MANQSEVLLLLYARADRKRKADGKNAPSGNYFLLAVSELMVEKERDELPTPFSFPENLPEIERIAEIMRPYMPRLKSVHDLIEEGLKDEKYNPFMDELMFRKIIMNAGAAAAAEKRDTYFADDVLGRVLAEPTDIIKKCITEFSEAAERSADEDGSEDDEIDELYGKMVDDVIREVLEGDDGDDDGDEDEPEDTRGDALAELVKKTKEFQHALLSKVFGQDQAINVLVEGYFRSELIKMSERKRNKPRATFLFAGAPGVGKTFLAEQTAALLSRPFKCFDMSEYSERESTFDFSGTNPSYKSAKEGIVTGFVQKNPECILLFDEIEKAHAAIINLFLQILDAGRLHDTFTEKEVSFENAIIIFTTNAGKNLYENDSMSIVGASRKEIIKALSEDINPRTNAPYFPRAICSRLASGNVAMFNNLTANDLLKIAEKELDEQINDFHGSTGILVHAEPSIAPAILFSEGGKADARTVKGRTDSFFHAEMYELLRLLPQGSIGNIKSVQLNARLPEDNSDIKNLFSYTQTPGILVFADANVVEACRTNAKNAAVYGASTLAEAKELLFGQDITLILCDLMCGAPKGCGEVLNLEDVQSSGKEFFEYANEHYDTPFYILETDERKISWEETVSFIKNGAQGVLSVGDEKLPQFGEKALEISANAYLQSSLLKLSKMNKVLSYNTAQTVSASGDEATVELYGFSLALAMDAADAGSILGNLSKPSTRFADVIGAEDAKDELKYFVDYLKDPVKFVRKGVKAPKGILLYGPPGTGKTMLAKAMAGESDVTFIAAEGNQFLKRYVGEGAESVHELFGIARKYAPSILFIDEIDAIGRDRSDSSPAADASADVLTSFLTEMDGFRTDVNKPVFVLAATNFSVSRGTEKSLDPALLRRFDRRIYVDLPNAAERAKYIRLKITKNQNIKLSDEFIDNISTRSAGMSLAEIESIIELALRNSIKSQNNIVDDAVMEEAFETFANGEEKEWGTDQLKRTAIHESGHALICYSTGEIPSYLTVVARGSHGGYMQHASDEKKGIYTRSDLLGRIRTALGGRAAELVYFGSSDGLTTGPSGDLQTATALAKQLICNYGMDEYFGLATISPAEISGEFASEIRKRVSEILRSELDAAVEYISEHREVIDRLVSELMTKNHLKGDEMKKIFESLITG